jgi:hypothetical protein
MIAIASTPFATEPHRLLKYLASARDVELGQLVWHFGTTNIVDVRLIMHVIPLIWRFLRRPIGVLT